MKFEWKDEYTLDDTLIDNEHRHLFALANEIADSSANDELITHIMRLYKHIREHFRNEEELMRNQAYPGYGQHVDDHNQMLASLISKSDTIREGDWGKNQVIEFMKQWIAHITSGDRQFKDYRTSLGKLPNS
ncbi:MAG: hypothetical protein EPN89_14755 [Methylovulum sp.]|nr:MAG: hypothetical protein EPN89_14755 [Methylovulum sp.]